MSRILPLLSILAAVVVSAGLAACRVSGGATFDSKGVTIHYTVQGRGEPVLLIHGLASNGEINWRVPGIVGMLATNYQVITMDVRGHGHSGKPLDPRAYGVELVEDAVRLLDHLHIKKARVAGYSMGGMIALKMMARHPDRVQSAVIGGMGWMREGSPFQQSWANMPLRWRNRSVSLCARSLAMLALTAEELKGIRQPVTLIIGEQDPLKAVSVEPLHQARPDWPIIVVPQANHINCVPNPQFKAALRDALP